ncbi:Holliday junction resolvase RuvX [Patescibacteria group bacterium]|nr:Holliday junction resolvase RuvX [Patescibacteria group bacterium]
MLGIDYGKKKIGLAIADGPLAEPLKVIRYKLEEDVLRKVVEVVEVEKVEQAVIGISEREMAKETKNFARKLGNKLEIPISFQDETLTTKEAQDLSQEAGIKRKKRRELEDAYAATLILQAYLDSK